MHKRRGRVKVGINWYMVGSVGGWIGKKSQGMQSENKMRTRLQARDKGEDDEDEDNWYETRAKQG